MLLSLWIFLIDTASDVIYQYIYNNRTAPIYNIILN